MYLHQDVEFFFIKAKTPPVPEDQRGSSTGAGLRIVTVDRDARHPHLKDGRLLVPV